MSDPDYAKMTGQEVRALCRAEKFCRPTAGVALGFAQANLVVIPARLADDFQMFCRLNPKPCPLLEVLPPGRYEPMLLAPGADLRTDLPRYRVFRQGVCAATPTDILAEWTDELVAMLIGCSFTFESALLEAGLPVRHIDQSCNVPMYRTSLRCRPVGPFVGPLVVSMRPMTPEQAAVATRVTSTYERAHGSPIHVGDAQAIGISDLTKPDHGDAVTFLPGEIPVFWACGVTPMEVIINAKLDVAITHDPGHMFVTDLLDSSLGE